MPAGDISTASGSAGRCRGSTAGRTRLGVLPDAASTTRNVANGQINIDVPIAKKSKDVLAFLGDLSINGNFALDQVSDFGTLKTIGYGANWSPITGVRIIASVTDQDDAPSATQLGDPVIVTPNVRMFDYTTGETATVTQQAGGNPFLLADSKHTFKLGLTLKPFGKTDLTLTANYVQSSTRNAIAGFPSATAQIEAAFPGPVHAQPDCRSRWHLPADLIDARPVNFARTERSQLRWGINFSKPIKSKLQKQIEAFRAGTGPDPRPALAGLRSLANQPSVFGGTLAQGFRGQGGQRGQGTTPTTPAAGTPPQRTAHRHRPMPRAAHRAVLMAAAPAAAVVSVAAVAVAAAGSAVAAPAAAADGCNSRSTTPGISPTASRSRRACRSSTCSTAARSDRVASRGTRSRRRPAIPTTASARGCRSIGRAGRA